MKIEIVPEGNRTKREGKDEFFSSTLLFDAVFGGVKKLFESVVTGIMDVVDGAVSLLLRRAFAVLLGAFGLWFLFSGFSDLLDFLYGIPGIGAITVGVLVFSSAIIVSAFSHRR